MTESTPRKRPSFIIIFGGGFLALVVILPVCWQIKAVFEPEPRGISTSFELAKVLKDYEANEVNATAKYQGKFLWISGKVADIRASGDQGIIAVTTDGNPLSAGAACYVNKENRKPVARLSKGDKVTVEGKLTSKLRDLILTECEVK